MLGMPSRLELVDGFWLAVWMIAGASFGFCCFGTFIGHGWISEYVQSIAAIFLCAIAGGVAWKVYRLVTKPPVQ